MSLATTNVTEPFAPGRTLKSFAQCSLRHQPLPSDVVAVREIVESSGYFSESEVEVAIELIEDRLSRGERSDYQCIFSDLHGRPIGFSCFGPIECTSGSFDLYWIAVHNDHRSGGIGRKLLEETERVIAQQGGTRIYLETSSRPQYLTTLRFYERCGYRVEAVLNDFYAPGDGKVILVKAL
jgi:D-alanine-D-alanine ligase